MIWMTTKKSIAVDYTAQFKRDLKRLRKKYPHVQNDLQPLIERLENGETPGDQVPRLDYTVYKVRIRNADQSRGTRGGYRVMYYIKAPQLMILLRIYPKSARSDLPPDELRFIIEEYEASRKR
jgi:mRNA-degrading endonuclease RelE of RelBE toxin-antitoxin system